MNRPLAQQGPVKLQSAPRIRGAAEGHERDASSNPGLRVQVQSVTPAQNLRSLHRFGGSGLMPAASSGAWQPVVRRRGRQRADGRCDSGRLTSGATAPKVSTSQNRNGVLIPKGFTNAGWACQGRYRISGRTARWAVRCPGKAASPSAGSAGAYPVFARCPPQTGRTAAGRRKSKRCRCAAAFPCARSSGTPRRAGNTPGCQAD